MIKKLLIGFLSVSLSILSVNSFAASTLNTTQKATATLANSCRLTITDVNFGLFTPSTTGTVTALGNVAATCSKGITYSIQMNGFAVACNNRYMTSVSGNGSILYYNIYTDPSRTLIWSYSSFAGAGASCMNAGTSYPTLVGTGANQDIPVYGGMSANQFVPPGGYSGGVTVALYF